MQAIPDHTYKGVLRQVIPTADRTKATVTVKVSILDKDKYLKPEMSCNVTFLQPQKQAEKTAAAPRRIVTIPKDAVVTRDGKSVVFADRGQARSHQLPVVTGADLHGQSHREAGWRVGDAGEQSAAEAEGRGFGEGEELMASGSASTV